MKKIQECRADIRIFMFGQLRRCFYDSYARSEPAKRMGQFEPDVSTSQHDQMLGQAVEVERFHMGHGIRIS